MKNLSFKTIRELACDEPILYQCLSYQTIHDLSDEQTLVGIVLCLIESKNNLEKSLRKIHETTIHPIVYPNEFLDQIGD